VLLASLYLLYVLNRVVFKGWLWGSLLVAVPLLVNPAMRYWILNLHGHAYSSSIILSLMALGMAENFDKSRPRSPVLVIAGILAAFLGGFYSNYMLMTGTFVVFAAPAVGFFLGVQSQASLQSNWGRPLKLCFAVGLGLVASQALHFYQVANFLESWSLAWQDLFGTALARGADQVATTRLMLIGQYSIHVRTFFNVGSIAMVVYGILFCFLHQKPFRETRFKVLALVIAFCASYGWIMAMKTHSIIHTHVNPRIFLLLYCSFLIVMASACRERAQSAKT
jgi:hypothetical protein